MEELDSLAEAAEAIGRWAQQVYWFALLAMVVGTVNTLLLIRVLVALKALRQQVLQGIRELHPPEG